MANKMRNTVALLVSILLLSTTTISEPTKDPTKEPTTIPTWLPTLEPTLQPTALPSVTATSYPTEITTDPTINPTIEPTYQPTTDPTLEPTKSPSQAPSFSPSFSPTHSPTRYPIEDKLFDSYFNIKYLIKYLEDEYIEIFVNDAYTIINDITELIELSYFDITGLKYRFFTLQIHDILGHNKNDINDNNYQQFISASDSIPVDTNIQCDKAGCEILLNENYKHDFETLTQTRLRQYFTVAGATSNGNITITNTFSQLIFQIDSHGKIELLYPPDPITILTLIEDNKLLVVLLCIIILMCIISFFAFLHMKGLCCCTCGIVMDYSLYFALIIYGIQIIDVISDINLCIELMVHNAFLSDYRITIIGIASIIFILAAYGANLHFTGKFTNIIPQENNKSVLYFQQRSKMFIILFLFCGGCYPVLFLMSSGIFGLNYLCSGLTYYELQKMNKIKIIATIALSNVPQIFIQCVYAATLHKITINIAFAFITSVLNVICTPFGNRNMNQKYFSYYIQIEKILNENDDNYAGEIKFKSKKGTINEMCIIISDVIGCDKKHIEISRNVSVNEGGITLYVMQFIKDMNQVEIMKLYHEKKMFLQKQFQKHFELDEECKIIFKSAHNMKEILGGKDDNNMEELLKTMMNEKGLNYESTDHREKLLNSLYGNTDGYDNNKLDNGNEYKQEIKEEVEMNYVKVENKKEKKILYNINLNKQDEIIEEIENDKQDVVDDDEDSYSDIEFDC